MDAEVAIVTDAGLDGLVKFGGEWRHECNLLKVYSMTMLLSVTTFCGRRRPRISWRMRSARSRLAISGSSRAVDGVRKVTALRSESKPIPSRETSLRTIAS